MSMFVQLNLLFLAMAGGLVFGIPMSGESPGFTAPSQNWRAPRSIR